MNDDKTYCFDASIWTHRQSETALETYPSVWEKLLEKISHGKIYSCSLAAAELSQQFPEFPSLLAQTNMESALFMVPTANEITEATRLINEYQELSNPIILPSDTAPFTMAMAKARKLTYVLPIFTPAPSGQKSLSAICKEEQIQVASYSEVLRVEKWTF